MRQLLTQSQIEIWKNKILGKKIGRIWHSVGTFLWIDLGDVIGRESGANGFYDKYEYILNTSRFWIITKDSKPLLEVEEGSTHEEIMEVLQKLPIENLKLVDLVTFEHTAKIVLNEGYEIVLKKAVKDAAELNISFPLENKYLTFDINNQGYLQNYDDPVEVELI